MPDASLTSLRGLAVFAPMCLSCLQAAGSFQGRSLESQIAHLSAACFSLKYVACWNRGNLSRLQNSHSVVLLLGLTVRKLCNS